jgi:uncharacterized RDD family membrane protein YckC
MPEQERQIVDTRVTVETPEGVDFRFVIAGPGKRGAAFAIDTILLVSVMGAIIILVITLTQIAQAFFGMGIMFMLLLMFASQWLYRSVFEAFWNGQTPAKKMLNLRVVRTNGTPIGWFEAFGRNVLLVADGMVPFGIIGLNTVGVLTMSVTPRLQRLGDLFFDTMVIDETRETGGRSVGVTSGVQIIQRAECTGRFNVPERTLAIIERLFDKDRLISDARREEIARVLSVTLKKRLGYQDLGPDADNPHPYFKNAPQKHAIFLRRILKTFADDPDGNTSTDEEERRHRDSLNAALSAVRQSRSSQTAEPGAREIRPREHNPFLMNADGPADKGLRSTEDRL